MKEKDFQAQFNIQNNVEGVFELKMCSLVKKKSLPFSALAYHQEKALLLASSPMGLQWKITDQPIFKGKGTRFHTKKPFDSFNLKNQPAFVVVMFWYPRKIKNVYYIEIHDFIRMREEAICITGRKSFNEAMADSYATYHDNYLKK